jgi:hypothetical protein
LTLRRYLPVIAGVVFACAGGSALVSWLARPPHTDPFADEQSLAPIPERATRARKARSAPAAPPGCTATTGAPAAPTTGAPAAAPATAPKTMLEACPGGTRT